MAEEQSKLIDERLATKLDIELVRANIEQLRLLTKADIATSIAASEAKLMIVIKKSKSEMIRWVIGTGFAQTAFILAVLKLHG